MKKQEQRELSCDNKIALYLHCALCAKEVPEGISPQEYSRTQAGWTKEGLQVWCNRHNVNVIHIDFEGAQHPANQTRNPTPEEEALR